MKNSFTVRLRSPMGHKGPAFGADRRGEAALVIIPGDGTPVPGEGSAFVQFAGDDGIRVTDDGGNFLIPPLKTREKAVTGEGPAPETFLLGAYLCAVDDGAALVSPHFSRAVLFGGIDVLIVLIPESRRGRAPYRAVAQTRALENSLFVVLAGDGDGGVAFAPGGALITPVLSSGGREEIIIEKERLQSRGSN